MYPRRPRHVASERGRVATCCDRGRGRAHGHKRQIEDTHEHGRNKLRPSRRHIPNRATTACGRELSRPNRTRFGASALVGQDPDKAEAAVAVAVGRVVAAPVGRSAEDRVAAPASAALHPARTRGRTFRIGPVVQRPVPVTAPLPHISDHVIETPGVRKPRPDRMRLQAGVVSVSGIGAVHRVPPVVVVDRHPRPACVLPLRLRR